jgi:hemerythrin-like domain-containing protein
MPADGFLSLLETHDHLDELFTLHQKAVLVMRWPLAVELLNAYRSLLTLHVDHEEERLLPLFHRSGKIAGAPVELFTGQHRKMFVQLARVAGLLAAIEQNDDICRSAIAVLDHETAFKHLVEHHDGAEAEHFYPALQRVASTQEVAEIVVLCWQQWSAARAVLAPLVERAQQELNVSRT